MCWKKALNIVVRVNHPCTSLQVLWRNLENPTFDSYFSLLRLARVTMWWQLAVVRVRFIEWFLKSSLMDYIPVISNITFGARPWACWTMAKIFCDHSQLKSPPKNCFWEFSVTSKNGKWMVDLCQVTEQNSWLATKIEYKQIITKFIKTMSES